MSSAALPCWASVAATGEWDDRSTGPACCQPAAAPLRALAARAWASLPAAGRILAAHWTRSSAAAGRREQQGWLDAPVDCVLPVEAQGPPEHGRPAHGPPAHGVAWPRVVALVWPLVVALVWPRAAPTDGVPGETSWQPLPPVCHCR